MDIAAPTPEPNATAVQRDRKRVFYALLGAAGLVAGIWLAWLGAFALGWDMDALGIRPRDPHGLVGILTAPLVHASFEHLMSNTLPLGLLAALTLYAYPRASRVALPLIWLGSGLGVWLWARSSVHVGISGITHGLMFFLFVIGLVRRDRLGVAIALLVFFLYGGMLMTVLPREQQVSFEYHLAGAVMGALAALLTFRLDAALPRKRYSWEDEEHDEDVHATANDELEPPAPQDVPVLWDGPRPRHNGGGNVIVFRRPDA
ncbi:MAG TPA: rhomboid family intramembrane serine protease [Rudaea sp.]|jgi:membrane associated rhomboid family serine protease|uniref:rhomboid family intramembrane serine protease n=1 Tax=Rudaea sp. TaxID=2136325 RepID=UPI002F94D2EC